MELEAPSARGSEAVVLQRGMLLDGTGRPPVREDLRLRGGRIVERGPDLPVTGAAVIDVRGRYVGPGFIDVHSHSDNVVLLNPGLDSKVAQGVTTEVVGNCGESLFPFVSHRRAEFRQLVSAYYPGIAERLEWDWTSLASWKTRVAERKPAVHLAPLVGHGTVRIAVMGFEARAPTPSEQAEMEAHVELALAQGAFGMSTGLAYPPGFVARPSELLPLVRSVASHQAVYATHMRNESREVFACVDSSIDLARECGARLEISHLKLMGRFQWGRAHELLQRLTSARASGVRVRADQYPYAAAETGLFVVLPPWILDSTWEETVRRLADPDTRRRVLEDMAAGVPGWELAREEGGWDRFVISDVHSEAGRRWVGRSVEEIARTEGRPPAETALSILEAEGGDVTVLLFALNEKDVQTIGEDPETFVGSDGVGNSIEQGPIRGQIHPRNYGTFPRFLAIHASAGGAPIETCIRRMTGAPADHFDIPERGYLFPGRVADLVVWPMEAHDLGPQFGELPRYAQLFESVWVAGEPALWTGRFTNRRAGEVLRHSEPVAAIEQKN